MITAREVFTGKPVLSNAATVGALHHAFIKDCERRGKEATKRQASAWLRSHGYRKEKVG